MRCCERANTISRRWRSAFCILSAGIFRGNCPLKTIIKKGMDSIAKYAYAELDRVAFCAFTPMEQTKVDAIVSDLRNTFGRIHYDSMEGSSR